MKMNRYQIEHFNDYLTIIRVQGCDPELPTIEAYVTPDRGYCDIRIAAGGEIVATTSIRRGKAFAIRVAKCMLKGFLSRLGKHGATMTNATKPRRTKLREAGVREIARLTGYSNCYVCIVRQGQRKARPLRARMRELGLKFREGK